MAEQSNSVGSLVRAADDRNVREKANAAKLPALTNAQICARLNEMIRSKVWWLDKFSEGRTKRPDNEIISARRQLAALVQAEELLKGERSAPDRGG